MRLPHFSYQDPDTLAEVLAIMAAEQSQARLLAGGTDLLPLMKYGLAAPATLVSLKNVAELRGVQRQEQEVYIGAMTSLAELSASPLIQDFFPGLLEAAEAVAAPPLWNTATLAGNLCQDTRCLYYNQSQAWRLERPPCFKAGGDRCHVVPRGKKCFSVYCGDLAPALIALEGRLTIRSRDRTRIIPVPELFSGNGLHPYTLDADEVVTGVSLPLAGEGDGSSYVKMRLREAIDYPLLAAAAALSRRGLRLEKALIVLGAVGPAPVAVEALALYPEGRPERFQTGSFRDLGGLGLALVDNLALPGSYRKKMLPLMAEKALQRALQSMVQKEQP